MELHRAAQIGAHLGHAFADPSAESEARQAREREIAGVLRQLFLRARVGREVGDDALAGRFAEHQQIEQRIAAQAVRAMHRYAGALAGRIQALHDLFAALPVRHDDLTVIVGRDAAHLVMRTSGTTGIGSVTGSTFANFLAISRMPGSRLSITSAPR